jgi:DNA polymerase-1
MLVTDLGQLPPSLDGQGMIGIDLETFDPELKTRGPGPHRDGFIAGIAIGTEAGFRAYIPISHETGPNVPRLSALHWLGQQLTLNVPKVGARLLYDLVFLLQAGVPCAGPWYDIQIAEPLLDENQFTYSLDRISEHWLGEGKVDAELDAFLIKTFGKKQPRSNIWRAPPALVAPYAVGDVDLPLRVFPRQKAQLEQEGLWDLFLLETRLTELLARMHLRGVPVDLKAAERLDRLYQKEYDALLASIRHSTGVEVNIWAARSIAQVFDQLGLAYPLTAKTQAPSFTRGWLATVEHPLAQQIQRARWLDKMRGTFLQGAVLNGNHCSRIHTTFNQLRSDEGGTVTGRFSSSLPNLQHIPSRTAESKVIRRVFVPEPNSHWLKFDWSQVEYRLIVHDAACAEYPGADEVVHRYRNDPSTDFHAVIADLTGLDRYSAKTINFGLAYGEGSKTLARQLRKSLAEAEVLLRHYHTSAPFIRPLSQYLSAIAGRKGVVETLLGRKRRFNKWSKRLQDGTLLVRPEYFKGSQRAFLHAALNARIQGSAADIMKLAMVKVAESGAIDVLGVPHLTVHDELDFSLPKTASGLEAAREVRHIMETCVDLRVPLRVDVGLGPSWGQAEDDWL